MVSADEIICYKEGDDPTDPDTKRTVISAVPSGYYYLPFDSNESSGKDLLEQGGTSSWGGAQVKGLIRIYKTVDPSAGVTKYAYAITMIDAGGRGIYAKATQSGQEDPRFVLEEELARQDVKTADLNTEFTTATDVPNDNSTPPKPVVTACEVHTG